MQSTSSPKVSAPEIFSIHAEHGLTLSWQDRIISPYANLLSASLSSRTPGAVAFDLGAAATSGLTVQLAGAGEDDAAVDGLNAAGETVFTGTLQPGPNTTGQHTVLLQSALPSASVSHNKTVINTWNLRKQDGSHQRLSSPPLEVYWVNLSAIPPGLYRKGLPLEGLRALASLINNPQQLTQMVFTYNPPNYDIWTGASYFISGGWNALTLNYTGYYNSHGSPYSLLNCFDAAAVLQYLLNLNGYLTNYCVMDPFGYMTLTNLIGRGTCNNPFYGSSGGYPVVNPYDVTRTNFARHGFVYLQTSATIADACAGPHIGNESPAAYVAAAVDTQYPPSRPLQGTVANIAPYTGVVHTNFLAPLDMSRPPAYLDLFKARLQYPDRRVYTYNTDGSGVAGTWHAPNEYPSLGQGWTIQSNHLMPGATTTLRHWILNRDSQFLSVRLYVHSGDLQESYDRFLLLPSLDQLDLARYSIGTEGDYSFFLQTPGVTRTCWVYHNIVMDITSSDPTLDIKGLSNWYYQFAIRNLREDLKRWLPAAHIGISSPQPKAGDHLHLSIPSSATLTLDYVDEPALPRLIGQSDQTLVFDIDQPFTGSLQALIIDHATGLVGQQTVAFGPVE